MTAAVIDFSAYKAARIAAGTWPRLPTVATFKRARELLNRADVPTPETPKPPTSLDDFKW